MKKYFYLLALVLVVTACSADDSSRYESTESFSNTSTTIDIATINGSPEDIFDNTSKGLYHGVIVTTDMSIHGKIWINVANDGTYGATVVTDKLEQILFNGVPATKDEVVIHFAGKSGSFTFDVSDLNAPKATAVSINGIDGHIQTVKDRSNQRASATLGTYVDDNDPSFTGPWDLITDGSTTGTAFGYPALTQITFLNPIGNMFVIDQDQFTSFAFPCLDVADTVPVFHAAGGAAGNINEFWAQGQTTMIAGKELSYTLGQSSTLSQNDGGTSFGNTTFLNNDLADPATAGCFVILGRKGIWAWNGREGSVFFDDPFDSL